MGFCKKGIETFIFLIASTFYLNAQPTTSMSHYVTWTQASMQAATENKLVFALININTSDKNTRAIFADRSVQSYLSRNAVGFTVDIPSEEGKKIESKLLLQEPPLYAFFMPFGDLLLALSPQQVATPADFIQAINDALEKAEIKKTNSRSVNFYNSDWEYLIRQARNEDKPLMVMAYSPNSQPSLLMEKNVLNLNVVADYYNNNFINTKTDTIPSNNYPLWLFYTPSEKLFYQAEGYANTEEFLEIGKQALKKFQGIDFSKSDWEEVLKEAREKRKFIFLDAYTIQTEGDRVPENPAYRDPELTQLVNENFLSLRLNMGSGTGKQLKDKTGIAEKNAVFFLDSSGNPIHWLAGVSELENLLDATQRTLENKGVISYNQKYQQGDRNADFIEEYMAVLVQAGLKKDASRVAQEYLLQMGVESLLQPQNWQIYNEYVTDYDNHLFEYILKHKKQFTEKIGEKQVNSKINAIWVSGADSFLTYKNGIVSFDEAGFKNFTKKMKQQKVSDWRSISRNARLKAAERMADWKTFSFVAEEKWHEGEYTDNDLLNWATLIKNNCNDIGIRQRTARWLVTALNQVEQRERSTGKISAITYRGHLQKLINDLLE
ncbi:MAG: hypothetical protein LIO65_09775 [Odoribacter sp.]|nr:hypothetical protein [Odoribacter sp.]